MPLSPDKELELIMIELELRKRDEQNITPVEDAIKPKTVNEPKIPEVPVSATATAPPEQGQTVPSPPPGASESTREFMDELANTLMPGTAEQIREIEKQGGDISLIGAAGITLGGLSEAILGTPVRVASGFVKGAGTAIADGVERGANKFREEVQDPEGGLLQSVREAIDETKLPGYAKFISKVAVSPLEDPFGIAKFPFTLLSKAANVTSRLFGKGANKLTMAKIKPMDVDIKAGFKKETLKEFDLTGSISTIEKRLKEKLLPDLGKRLESVIDANTAKINVHDALAETAQDVMKTFPENFLLTKAIKKELKELRESLNDLKINGFIDKDGMTDMLTATKIKRGAGNEASFRHGFKDKDIKAVEIITRNFYQKMRKAIEESDVTGEIKEINSQFAKLIPVEQAIYRRAKAVDRQELFNHFDMASLAMGGPQRLAFTSPVRGVATSIAETGSKKVEKFFGNFEEFLTSIAKKGNKKEAIKRGAGAQISRSLAAPKKEPEPPPGVNPLTP